MIEQKIFRCAVYTRKSSEEGLEQDFNSLEAQREACEAYIRSQSHEGWKLIPDRFDDGGFSGGNMERPALGKLMSMIRDGKVDVIVIYKIDRLTRSLADFARLAETFDKHGVSFVSVTQQFNTTTSMGRLMLNVLLSFAQFEREITGERIRDKIAASERPSNDGLNALAWSPVSALRRLSLPAKVALENEAVWTTVGGFVERSPPDLPAMGRRIAATFHRLRKSPYAETVMRTISMT